MALSCAIRAFANSRPPANRDAHADSDRDADPDRVSDPDRDAGAHPNAGQPARASRKVAQIAVKTTGTPMLKSSMLVWAAVE